MTGDELNQVLTVMDSLWPHASVIERWGPGMALMCGELALGDTLAVVRDLAAPAVGPAPAWPPAPGVVRTTVERRHEAQRVCSMISPALETPRSLGA